MGSTIPPTMILPGTPTLDKIPPIGHHQSCINQQHIFLSYQQSLYGQKPENMELKATDTTNLHGNV